MSAMATLGWSPGAGPFRLGVSVAPQYLGELETSGAIQSTSSPQMSWEAGAQAAYLFAEGWAAGVAYTDQTLLGGARNAALYRGVTVSLQRRWDR